MNQKEGKSDLPALQIKRLTGSEPFHANGTPIGMEVLDFWRWALSDLAGNNLRGHLAEFIVAKALDLPMAVRAEWDECDLLTEDGIRIEVKSAAYIQSWAQEQHSRISFGIAPAYGWDAAANARRTHAARNSDAYVFCLQRHKDQSTFDPLDMTQWRFFVLATSVLDEKVGEQKTITLNSLMLLSPQESSFSNLRETLRKACAPQTE